MMIDLGWTNAGKKTAEQINAIHKGCRDLGHKSKTTNEGLYGTVHTVSCDICRYLYHYDSGD